MSDPNDERRRVRRLPRLPPNPPDIPQEQPTNRPLRDHPPLHHNYPYYQRSRSAIPEMTEHQRAMSNQRSLIYETEIEIHPVQPYIQKIDSPYNRDFQIAILQHRNELQRPSRPRHRDVFHSNCDNRPPVFRHHSEGHPTTYNNDTRPPRPTYRDRDIGHPTTYKPDRVPSTSQDRDIGDPKTYNNYRVPSTSQDRDNGDPTTYYSDSPPSRSRHRGAKLPTLYKRGGATFVAHHRRAVLPTTNHREGGASTTEHREAMLHTTFNTNSPPSTSRHRGAKLPTLYKRGGATYVAHHRQATLPSTYNNYGGASSQHFFEVPLNTWNPNFQTSNARHPVVLPSSAYPRDVQPSSSRNYNRYQSQGSFSTDAAFEEDTSISHDDQPSTSSNGEKSMSIVTCNSVQSSSRPLYQAPTVHIVNDAQQRSPNRTETRNRSQSANRDTGDKAGCFTYYCPIFHLTGLQITGFDSMNPPFSIGASPLTADMWKEIQSKNLNLNPLITTYLGKCLKLHEGFCCPSCGVIPVRPVTGPCGHSRCFDCIRAVTTCPCGVEASDNFPAANDVVVQRMLECFLLHFESRWLKVLWYLRGLNEDVQRLSSHPNPNTTMSMQNMPEWFRQLLQAYIDNQLLECVLCLNMYRDPVTTPCGHTFCRYCIERTFGYHLRCPLCATSLSKWDVDGTKPNSFIATAVEATGLPLEREERDPEDQRLPIFVCTVAYPMVPCPLYVYEPRYRLLIRRCLRSQRKVFGMVVSDQRGGYVEYGTVLEIRDCFRMPCGGYIVSTMGVSRFRVLERSLLDGYDVALVDPIVDTPSLSLTARRTQNYCFGMLREMALVWLRNICQQKLALVQATYGNMPSMNDTNTESPDGPAWTWWLLALLPLSVELKIMILSSPHLNKRMMSGIRTLYLLQSYRLRTQEGLVQSGLAESYMTPTM